MRQARTLFPRRWTRCRMHYNSSLQDIHSGLQDATYFGDANSIEIFSLRLVNNDLHLEVSLVNKAYLFNIFGNSDYITSRAAIFNKAVFRWLCWIWAWSSTRLSYDDAEGLAPSDTVVLCRKTWIHASLSASSSDCHPGIFNTYRILATPKVLHHWFGEILWTLADH